MGVVSRGKEIDLPAALVKEEFLTWDESRDGYCLGAEHEVDVCCHLAHEADILAPDEIAEMKTFFASSEAEGFQRQPM